MRLKNVTIEDFSKQHPLGQIGRNLTLQVKDIMHRNSSLPIIGTGASFRDAVIEITNKALGCVCVVDEDMNLAGIITDGDIRRTLQKHEDIRGLMASEIMTKSPVKISADIYLGEALSVMENRNSQINVLPVVEEAGNKCVGVIRLHDIVRSGI
jgi:arabinose-5-phosphate isomerase